MSPSAPFQPGRANGPSNHILAIDGPAGAGKSTVAAHMARRFGLLNIETGAMYRAFALKALQTGTDLEDSAALARLSEHTTVQLLPEPGGNRVLLDGGDVTTKVRTPEVTDAASRVSVHAPVRAWLVRLQQALGEGSQPGSQHGHIQGIVMEGRDIGTVVFPHASLKIFLFASPEARTERRLAQTPGAAEAVDSGEVLAALQARDERDRSRAESPLRPAEDAVVLDSTHLPLDQVIERVAALVVERWQLAPAEATPARR